MKKVFLIALMSVFTLGFVSCTNDTAEEDELIDVLASDKDEEPDK